MEGENQLQSPVLPVGGLPLDDVAKLQLFETTHFRSATEEYQCPICLQVCNQPQVSNNATEKDEECLHVYCLDCIRPALEIKEQCPICRRSLTLAQLTPLAFLEGKIGALDVQCVLHERGCKWTGTFGRQGKRLREHLDTCAHVVVGCSHDACEQHMPRANKPSHEAECGKRPAPCPLCEFVLCADAHTAHHAEVCPKVSVVCKECEKSVIRDSMKTHVSENCPRRSMQCPLGCSIRADQLTQHMQDAAVQHVAVLCERSNKQQVDLTSLSESLNQQQASHAILQQEHAALKQHLLGCMEASVTFGRVVVDAVIKEVRLANMVVRCSLRFNKRTRAVGFFVKLRFPIPCIPGPFAGRLDVELSGKLPGTTRQDSFGDDEPTWTTGEAEFGWDTFATLAPDENPLDVVFRLSIVL